MILRRLALALACSFAVGDVAASFSGSPICHADDIFDSIMGDWVGLGTPFYRVRAEPAAYVAGATLSIHVEADIATGYFNGLLLYVEDPQVLDAEMRPSKVGHFAAPIPGFRFIDGCTPVLGTHTLTHADNANHPLPATFAWTAPNADRGTLHLRAIVLRIGMPGDWMEHPYQVYDIELPYRDVFTDSFE